MATSTITKPASWETFDPSTGANDNSPGGGGASGGSGGGTGGTVLLTYFYWDRTSVIVDYKELNFIVGYKTNSKVTTGTKLTISGNSFVTGTISTFTYNGTYYYGNVLFSCSLNSSSSSRECYPKAPIGKLTNTLTISQSGKLTSLITDLGGKRSYYNSLFIYDNTGYHEGEIYRFGIVYIRKDNSLTLVYDILGKNVISSYRPILSFPDDMSDYLDGSNNIYWDGLTTEPVNGTIFDSEYSDDKYNIKGICRFKNCIDNLTDIIGVRFTFPDDFYTKLKDNYKGFFFVRLKRIPTMLALGYATNICEDSYVPSINIPVNSSTDTGFGKKYYLYESFVTGAFRFLNQTELPETFYPTKIAAKAKSTHKLIKNYRSRLFSLSDYTYLYLDRIVGYGPMSSFLAQADSDFCKDSICPTLEMSFTHINQDDPDHPTDEEYYAVAYKCHEKDSWGGLTTDNNKDLIMILRIMKLVNLTGTQTVVCEGTGTLDDSKSDYNDHSEYFYAVNKKKDCNDGWYGKATSGKVNLYRTKDKNHYLRRESRLLTRDDGLNGLGYDIISCNNKYYLRINGQTYEDYCGVYAHDNGSTNCCFEELYYGVLQYIETYESGISVESNLLSDFTAPTFDGKYSAKSDKEIGTKGQDKSRILLHPTELGAYGVYCPEYELNLPKYNSLFTGLSFKVMPITKALYLTANLNTNIKKRHFTYDNTVIDKTTTGNNCNVISVADGVSLLSNQSEIDEGYGHKNTGTNTVFFYNHYGKTYFSSKIGDASEVSFKYAGGKYVCYVKPTNSKLDDVHCSRLITDAPFNIVRGIYGPYLGVSIQDKANIDWNDSNTNLADTIVLIMIPNYSEDNMSEYFTIRKDDTSFYQAIGDRISLEKYYHFINGEEEYANLNRCYRGDCYINWYTHRVNRNFNDSTAPYNDTVLDVKSFSNSFSSCYDSEYRTFDLTKDAEAANNFNIGDINAIELGSWITFPIRSTMNTALRSIDNSYTSEKLACGHGRTFYPRGSLDSGGNSKLPESDSFNSGYDKSGSEKKYFNLNNNIFVNTYFKNRILYSNVLLHGTFTNGHRTFLSMHYKDYTDLYGEIVKIIELKGDLVVVCEHGILLIPVNERALAGEGSGGSVYINTSNVLPDNPGIISETYGSRFADSIIKTPVGIYGVDESSKKIWFTNGSSFKIISDFKILKFLNKHLNLDGEYVTLKQIKTHYNAFKNDVIFTLYNITPFYKDDPDTEDVEQATPDELWSLCWNENQAASGENGWITYYSWIPIISNNIGNCFITSDLMDYNYAYQLDMPISYIWKHGQSERVTSSEIIKPTSWYNVLHPFEFEFIVNKDISQLKMFDNLQIISNKVKPESFHFEVIGESYEFANDKQTAYIRLELTKKLFSELTGSEISYTDVSDLMAVRQVKSTIFPMYYNRFDVKNQIYDAYKHMNGIRNSSYDYDALSGTEVLHYPEYNEFRLCEHVKAVDAEGPGGLLRGNMRYKEDKWDILINPINLLLKNEYYYDNTATKVYDWIDGKVPIVIPNIKVNDSVKTSFTSEELNTTLPGYTPLDILPNTQRIYYRGSSDDSSQYITLENNWDIAQRKEARVRDKFMKVKIRYTGDELATIMGVNTLYTISYA